MKKTLILTVYFLFSASVIFAQNYIAFRTNGRVVINENLAEIGDTITPHANIHLDNDSELMLIDEVNNKMVTIKGLVDGKLIDILKTSNVSLKDVTSKYVSYMKQKLGNKNNDKNYMQSAGTAYRETDSIAKQRLSNLERK